MAISNQAATPPRLSPQQLQPMLKAFTDRLYDTVSRGPVLRCFATKSSRVRVDVLKFKDTISGHQRPVNVGVPEELVRELIRHDASEYSVQLDISNPDPEIRERSLSLYHSISQGIVRSSEAIYRETGLRTLWLAYPFILLRDINDPDDKRSILAPLYLWPISISTSLARQGELKISRNPDAGPPIFNRVLARWARTRLAVDIDPLELDANGDGEIEIEELQNTTKELLRGFARMEFAALDGPLSPLPSRKDANSLNQPALLNTAVLGLFISENQALIENLERLQQLQTVADPLDSLLANRQADPIQIELPAERDRYLVTDSDPYQERAVWESRRAPGNVVHGPPGTGKSQTIVNIVADSLAHGEKVLVVCQKRAAIDVVFERLRGVGLADSTVVIHDAESDRRQLYAELKEQIDALHNVLPGGYAHERQRLAEDIDRREKLLDGYHNALHVPRSAVGISYRQIVGRASGIYNANRWVRSIASLEKLAVDLTVTDLGRLEDSLRGLSQLWDTASPDKNPWRHRNRDFALTKPLRDEIVSVIDEALSAAVAVEQHVRSHGAPFALPPDQMAFQKEAARWCSWGEKLAASDRFERCASWIDRAKKYGVLAVSAQSRTLNSLNTHCDRFTGIAKSERVFSAVAAQGLNGIDQLRNGAEVVERRRNGAWWLIFSPRYWSASKQLRRLNIFGDSASVSSQCERFVLRSQVASTLESYDLLSDKNATDEELACRTRMEAAGAAAATTILEALESQLWLNDAVEAITVRDRSALTQWSAKTAFEIKRSSLVQECETSLTRLATWMKKMWLDELRAQLRTGVPIILVLEDLKSYLPKLQDLCAYDAASSSLTEEFRQVLQSLTQMPTNEGPAWFIWWPALQYSLYTAWGNKCLNETPILQTLSSEQYERERQALGTSLKRKRQIEVGAIKDRWLTKQSALYSLRPSPLVKLKSQLVTRGPNSKRLRQVVNLGAELGLFDLRPCWMMNPNTACQLFALHPGLFDLVVFDEASQCPLEQAIPTIYRGKRIVVAGDEKQLPPTSFFLSMTSVAELEADADTETTEEEIERSLRQDVLESKDLLSVSTSVLRNSYLDMHYRSEDPALIQFSNKAFYGGRLQCPPSRQARDHAQPAIEVREVGGTYEKQENRREAEAVADLIQEIWANENQSHTIGVVTFNLKQEDLIQNILQERALRLETFRIRYEAECHRQDGQQDVGFFVKNLESVQGDERDVMIFSTTYGKDSSGQFRRFFGPLNAEGGERRLNVAVTRAKKKIYIVTSLPVAQISDLFGAAGSRQVGARVSGRDYLHGYMKYAQAVSSGDIVSLDIVQAEIAELAKLAGIPAGRDGATVDADSDFELSVRDALLQQGLLVDTQVGDSGFRIDLAIRDPKNGGYVLGIECDGRTYHSAFTARARDIWRQQILETRGWNIHRIWSTNWWLDPEAEIQKIKLRVSSLCS